MQNLHSSRVFFLFAALLIAACGSPQSPDDASDTVGDRSADGFAGDSGAQDSGTDVVANMDVASDGTTIDVRSDVGTVETGADAIAEASRDVSSGDVPVVTDSGGGPCTGTMCSLGLTCCGGICANTSNDPNNCGACGTRCSGATSMCLGRCQAPTCEPACATGQTCCDIQGPGPSRPPMCIVGTTCPVGCPLCG